MYETTVKSLKVARLSTMPNQWQSYAYRVLDAEKPEVAKLLEDCDGVYDGQEGGKIIYSRSRIGKLNAPFTATIRVVEQVLDRVPTGKHFINLVDTSLEEFGGFASKVVLAERFGIKNSAAAVAAFYNVQGQSTPAPVKTDEPATDANKPDEQPVNQNKDLAGAGKE